MTQTYHYEERKVFHEADLPEFSPHISGIAQIMHSYTQRINGGGDAAMPYSEALDSYFNNALQQTATPGTAKYIREATISAADRMHINQRLTFNSTSENLNRHYQMLAANIGVSYTVSRYAADYFDKSFGDMPDDLEVTLAPGADPQKFIEAKMRVAAGGSTAARYRKQIPYEDFIAVDNFYEKRIGFNTSHLRSEYADMGIDFEESETRQAISDLMFMTTSRVPEAKKPLIRQFKAVATSDIIAQDFVSYQRHLEDFLIQVPEAASSVMLSKNHLDQEDISGLIKYNHEEKQVLKAEAAEAAKITSDRKKMGKESIHRALRNAMDDAAEHWLMESDAEGSVWQVVPIDEDQEPATFAIKGIHLNGYKQVAAWCADVARGDDGEYDTVSDTKVHIKALSLKTLIDVGLVQRVPDAQLGTKKSSRDNSETSSSYDGTLGFYSDAVASLIRRNPARPVTSEQVVSKVKAKLERDKKSRQNWQNNTTIEDFLSRY